MCCRAVSYIVSYIVRDAAMPWSTALLLEAVHKLHIHFLATLRVASKAITVGVGIPRRVVGGLRALLWAPSEVEMGSTVEFVGSLIGMLGVLFFIAGLFYAKEPVMH